MGPRIAIFAACMLLTGSLNTITTKYQDITVVGITESGRNIMFQHPAVQSAFMFLGEFLCLIPHFAHKLAVKRHKAKMGIESTHRPRAHTWRTLITFSVPAICDAGATTLLNLGLFYTFASTFQMLRGTLVIFAGFLTVTLLKRQLHAQHWLGIVLITAGAAIVGASSVLSSDNDLPTSLTANSSKRGSWLGALRGFSGSGDAATAPLFGDLLVILAQLAAATQFIVEEKYLAKFRVPALLAVGLEGFWGLVISAIALPILTHITGSSGVPFDDAIQALREIGASRQLQWTTFGSVVSIAFFNYFGVSVTKSLSGAARATIDACRTLLIWLFAIWVGWEQFHGLEVLGFLVLLSGTSLYNELLRSCMPATWSPGPADSAYQEPLLNGQEGTGDARRSGGRPPRAPVYSQRRLQERGDLEAAEPRSIQPPSHTYSMARSMRLFPSALSPHSLASPSHPHWHLLSRETSTESLVGQQGDGVVIIRGSDPPSPSNSEPQEDDEDDDALEVNTAEPARSPRRTQSQPALHPR
ncbi:hypothetical protein WJX84_010068 [Apatococcus fuscideae]|uniref:EamA domain-containing protein n=1 Tax=Apatococcus fuscideae TaxID=2026836 RepID=A0AAW1T2E9_9CHLO